MGRWSGSRGPRRGPRSRPAALVTLVIAAAVALDACAHAAPGWTYAPPTPAPGASLAAGASPTPARAAASPDAVPAAARPSAWVPPTPTPSPTPVPPSARRAVTVPILYYHRVAAPPAGFRDWPVARRRRFLEYDVIPAAFEAQLEWLRANGYTTVLPRDLAAFWDEGRPLPERPVILTFDDGTHDWTSTVLPALQARGMIAEFYVTLAAIPRGGMTWRELRAIVRAGNGIGAHGVRHRQLAMLPGRRRAAKPETMRREMEQPRTVLLARLGVLPDSVAYVGGGFNADLQAAARAAGYTTARSIIGGRRQVRGNRFELRVIRVGWRLDVIDAVRGRVRPGVPGFARLIEGR